MRPALPLAFTLIAAMASPALAAPICSGTFGLDPEIFSEAEINDFNFDLLRGRGVNVTRTEMWGGCIRAFVRQADGREAMEFYDPMTLRRVE